MAQLILRTHGASTEIARVAGFGRAYAYKVAHGFKPPSRRFLGALPLAFARLGVAYEIEALEMDSPEPAPPGPRVGAIRESPLRNPGGINPPLQVSRRRGS